MTSPAATGEDKGCAGMSMFQRINDGNICGTMSAALVRTQTIDTVKHAIRS